MQTTLRKIASVLRGSDLTRVRALRTTDVEMIARVLALGVQPGDVAAALAAYDPNTEYEPLPVGGAAPVRVILAYSFVRDPGQYHGTYGQTAEWARECQGLLETDPDAAIERIAAVVNARLRDRGSSAVAEVRLGQPRGTPNTGPGSQGPDAHYGALQHLMVSYSGQAGAYQFEATDSGDRKTPRYRVDLGGGLMAGAQSKKAAIMAAKLTRVFGRHKPELVPYVGYAADDGETWGGDIEDDAPDGRPERARPRERSPRVQSPKTPAHDESTG